MYKKSVLIVLCILIISCFISINYKCYAMEAKSEEIYIVKNEAGSVLFERNEVALGDVYISKDFLKYEVVSVNHENKTGVAKFIEQVKKPSVRTYYGPNRINNQTKKIGLYLTHNDESYITGDGVDSVYGVGGIHDIAKKIKSELTKYNIDVYLDETLHIPHDTSAYSRSKSTASSLLKNYELDAIFDIHRDGASRKSYVQNVNGVDKCMVRMVVGLGNGNNEINEEFATYIMSVANEMYPWLIKDIYFGKGHYNQNLYGKSILFEMGSHLVEKDLVMKSVAPLCDVINTALFETTVNNESGELTINGAENSNETLITNVEELNTKDGDGKVIQAVLIILGIVALIVGAYSINYYIDSKTYEK